MFESNRAGQRTRDLVEQLRERVVEVRERGELLLPLLLVLLLLRVFELCSIGVERGCVVSVSAGPRTRYGQAGRASGEAQEAKGQPEAGGRWWVVLRARERVRAAASGAHLVRLVALALLRSGGVLRRDALGLRFLLRGEEDGGIKGRWNNSELSLKHGRP